MADSQPPEGLQPRALIFRALRKLFHALGERGWVGHSTIASDCHSCNCATDAVLAEIEASGRLLPSGGEVKEQWAVRWHLVGGGVDEQDCYRNARETAEQRARRLASRPPMGVERGEALMRRIYTGPWSPVLSDNSEVTNAD